MTTSSRQPMWRCPEELAESESFRQLLAWRSPDVRWNELDSVSRRRFLELMGAALALASLSGCQRPREEIIPMVRGTGNVPGKPAYFATAMTLGGYGAGVLALQHEGRPTKVEGNPDHPASLGATDVFAQASVLGLYDPERSQAVMHKDRLSSWAAARQAIESAMAEERSRRGAGLRLIGGAVSSPTLIRQIERLLDELPEARWISYEPVSRDAVYAGTRQAFGRELEVVYDLTPASVIVALDADFLAAGPGHLRYARQFADGRRVWKSKSSEARMSRLYAVGPTPSPTSAVADHWLPLRAANVAAFARALAQRLDVSVPPAPPAPADIPGGWITTVADDLEQHRGAGLIMAGDSQPADVHALVHALNARLANAGRTVRYLPPVLARPAGQSASLAELAEELDAGQVETLVILDANPAFDAPAELQLDLRLAKAPRKIHLGLYRDETATLCDWHLPQAHYLESWGDTRALDGTASIVQPLIAPLYGGLSALEIVALLRGESGASGYDLVRSFWREQWEDDDQNFERRWQESLQGGVIAGSEFEAEEVALRDDWHSEDADAVPPSDASGGGLEIVFRADPTIYDGRFANNAWLQELPKPLTKLTWDNVAIFGPATARDLELQMQIGEDGGDMLVDVVRLQCLGQTVEAPIWILPGHAEGSVTVYFGYGRTRGGASAANAGFNAYPLRTSGRPWFDGGLQVEKTGRRYRLATTQLHHLMHGRDIVRAGTLAEYRENPAAPASSKREVEATRWALPLLAPAARERPSEAPPPSLYPEYPYDGHKWGMVIDQSACLGCSACVVACQAENNIPVVGKEEVARGREMHWLRVDAYYAGSDPAQPTATYFQPVPCMHCEHAPCELVCPVNATVHSDEGLNDMVYNRCVGTRYCSNNCPYKVRRFNFFQYADEKTESLKALRNPEVSVRSRGVMEKCTFCVQRIAAARIQAEKDDRPLVKNLAGQWIKPIHEHELLTACQAACPTRAITFGDLNDPSAEVGRMRRDQPLNYGLLAEDLGTRPRTTYLAALRNPNPAIPTP